MSDQRPFDTLNEFLNQKVVIKLKENCELTGVLKAFDAHMNAVLENATDPKTKKEYEKILVRGDTIVFISSAKE